MEDEDLGFEKFGDVEDYGDPYEEFDEDEFLPALIPLVAKAAPFIISALSSLFEEEQLDEEGDLDLYEDDSLDGYGDLEGDDDYEEWDSWSTARHRYLC